MTTPHDKAMETATQAASNAFGKAWLAGENITAAMVSAAISSYLSSLGGVVCAREPAAWLLIDPDGQLFPQATTRPQEPCDLLDIVPLHAPLPIAGKGDEGWKSIKTADKDAHRLMLGIVRKGVLEEIHIGGYRYALNDDEVSCWWSDQSDDEIVPTHWCEIPALPTPPSLLSEDTEGGV